MSHVKRYLDGCKTAYAHDVARITAALSMNGWGNLAEAIQKDFDEPTMGEELSKFWAETEPSQAEIFEAADAMSASLVPLGQQKLISRLHCRILGLDPDAKDGSQSQAETLLEMNGEISAPAKVDAGPETL